MGVMSLLRSIHFQAPLILLPTGRPINADLIIDVIKKTKPDLGFFAPSLLEDMCDTDAGMEALGVFEYVCYGGAPLSRAACNKITTVTNIQQIMGPTEAGIIPNLLTSEKEDWEYFRWSPESGIEIQPAGDDLCELVIRKHDVKYQAIFHTFPELDEWRTKDLYERYPDKAGLWRYKGRSDDVIVSLPTDSASNISEHD